MDAGALAQPPQILFSTPDGSAPLTYGSNGQFQISPGGPSEQREAPHGDTNSSGEDAVTEQQATPSHQVFPPESFASFLKSTPSPTRVPKSPLTTTGSARALSSNQVPTSSPLSSFPLFGISTETRSLSTFSLRPISSSKAISLSSVSRTVSGSSTAPLSSACARDPGYLCSSPTSTANFVTIAPAVPAKVTSSGVQSSSWYLAVIFGTIGGVALLIFIMTIIVVICRKVKRRRMAQNIDVPWATNPGDEEGRLFFASRDMSSRTVNSAQQKDLAQRQLRTSDRGIGVPVGSSANETEYNLYNHPIPGSRLFVETPPPLSEKLTLGHQSRPTNMLRVLPSHLIDEELAAQAIQGDGAYYFSGGLRRRSRGNLDDAIEINPYLNPPSEALNMVTNEHNTTSATLKHQPLIDRLRNLGKQDKDQPVVWDRLPTPGRDQSKEGKEPWASSFKAGLFNAINTITSGLKTHDSSGIGPDGDRLTQLPTRHRPSIRRSCVSKKSPTWILHEKDDGTGTVQFLPSLEKHYDPITPTSGRLVPVLSLERGSASFTPTHEKQDFRRTERLIYPKAPFLPTTAIVHPKHRRPSVTKRNPISRDSSVYSISSSITAKCDPPAAALSGRLAGMPVLDQHSIPHVDLDVVVLEPDILSPRGVV